MFSIIQSHKTQTLLHHLGQSYSQTLEQGQSIFDEFIVLVPSMVLGDWLQKAIASNYGISTMITTTFWGQYQWRLMQLVLEQYNQQLRTMGKAHEIVTVPEVAVLSSRVMQWRLFAYLLNQQAVIVADKNHPLHSFLVRIIHKEELHSEALANSANSQQQTQQQFSKQCFKQGSKQDHTKDPKKDNETRLWQLASDFAKVFNNYLTHRSEWLDSWTVGESINVEQLIAEKDRLNSLFAHNSKDKDSSTDTTTNTTDSQQLTPEWLVEHYIELEQVQGYLWRLLFAGAYQHRRQIESNFWQGIANPTVFEQANLPKCLYLFTVQQLPLSELNFLQRLSQFIDIKLFHYNPSQMFWADIVDKRWLAHQQIINPKHVYLRDYGHSLLSRLGKQSRETFASLASLSGNEDSANFKLQWQDDFENRFDGCSEDFSNADGFNEDGLQPSLLQRVQQDVLMLDESATAQQVGRQVISALQAVDDDSFEQLLKNKQIDNDRHWQVDYDDSIQIHACHSLQRQLEVLRHHIAYWLNGGDNDNNQNSRQLADIVVLLPDVEANEDLIRAVFVEGVGQDGLHLPARITGVVDKSIRQLWQAICGYYRLLGASFARFEAQEVLDWLSLPTLTASLGLTTEQMARACDLLLEAGFVRGFDEQHLMQSLDHADHDYRFSFAYALDKLVLGLTMPQAKISDCLYANAESYPQAESHEQWQANQIAEQTIPNSQVTLNDAPIIDALCRVYQSLDKHRQQYQLRKSPAQWITDIEEQVIHPLFSVYDQTKEMRAIFKAMNGFRRSLRANERSKNYYPNSLDMSVLQNQPNATEQTSNDFSLGLQFVLESIESELESQQISAEPTGVITFARFGSLRTVPYPLVVMLNMNLSEFPRQDKNDRYDLMKAGLARRGDRSSEDDDNGAFLDALLCAEDSCWIFYNGRSLQDSHEHLPANPVSELLQFLQGEIQWQTDDLLTTTSENRPQTMGESQTVESLQTSIEQYLPKLIENWLVTKHAPLPFSPQVFEMPDFDSVNANKEQTDEEQSLNDTLKKQLSQRMQLNKLAWQRQLPPIPLWTNVYRRLHHIAEEGEEYGGGNGVENTDRYYLKNSLKSSLTNDLTKVRLLTQADYQRIAQLLTANSHSEQQCEIATIYQQLQQDSELATSLEEGLPTHIDINQLARQVRHPAISYLRQQQVHIASDEEQLLRQEPLALTPLSRYQLNQQLLQQLTNTDDPQNNTLSAEQLLFTPIIPAGVARLSTLNNQQRQLQAQFDELEQLLRDNGIDKDKSEDKNLPQPLFNKEEGSSPKSEIITPCQEVTKIVSLTLFGKPYELQLKGQLPQSLTTTRWVNMLANSASGNHLMRFWLSHVYWQIARNTTAEQVDNNDGISICYFNKANTSIKALDKKQILSLPPLTTEQASIELSKWLMFAQLCQQLPIVLMPDYALTYLDKLNNADKSASLDKSNYAPIAKDYTNWLGTGYHQTSSIVFNSSSKHPVWQYILSDSRDSSDNRRAFSALKIALQTLAEPLFAEMYGALYAE